MPTDSRQMAPEMPQVEPGHIPIVPRQPQAAVEPPPPPTDPGFVAMKVDMPRLDDDATAVASAAPASSQLPRGLRMATGGLPPPLKDLKDYEPPDPSAPIKEAARKALNTRGKSGRPVWQELALAYVNRNQLRGRAARQAVQMFQTRAQGASPLEMRTVGAVEPKQSGNTPIENFLAARAQQSERLAPAVAGLMQRVGEEPSVPPSEIQRQIQADNPYESNTISGFLGEAEGNIERFVPAVLAPPTSTPLLALTGAEVAGQQYAEIDARRRAGQQISQSAADFNALANAAAEFVFERFGLGALQKHGTTLVRHTLKRVGIDLAKALGTNAAEEIATQAAQNAINRHTIAPETGYLDNVLRAGALGAAGAGMIAGPVAAGRAALVLGSRQSQQGNQAQAQQQQPSEPAAQQPTAAPPAAEPQPEPGFVLIRALPSPQQATVRPVESRAGGLTQAPTQIIPPGEQPIMAQPPQRPALPPPQQPQAQAVQATQKPVEVVPSEPVAKTAQAEVEVPPAPSEAARAYVERVLRNAQRWGKGNPSQYASRRLREYAASLSLSRDFLQSKEDFDKTDNGKFATYLVDVARLIDAGKIAIPPATPPQTKTPEGTTEMPRGAEPATQEPVEAAPVTPQASPEIAIEYEQRTVYRKGKGGKQVPDGQVIEPVVVLGGRRWTRAEVQQAVNTGKADAVPVEVLYLLANNRDLDDGSRQRVVEYARQNRKANPTIEEIATMLSPNGGREAESGSRYISVPNDEHKVIRIADHYKPFGENAAVNIVVTDPPSIVRQRIAEAQSLLAAEGERRQPAQTKTPEGTTEMPRGAEPAPTGGLTNQQQPTAPAVRGQEVSSEVSQPPDDMRPVEGRPISFEQWLASKGIDRRSVLSEQEEADFIGATVFPRIMTGHQSGKYKSLAARYERTRQLLEQYAREVPNVVMGYVPLTDSPADQAYRRVLQKRRERQRLAAKQETTNATGVSGDAGQVSQAGDEPQGGQVQGRENLQQPPPGQPGGTGLRQEAQEQRAVSQLPGDEVASTPPQPQSVLDLRLPEPSGKSVEDIKKELQRTERARAEIMDARKPLYEQREQREWQLRANPQHRETVAQALRGKRGKQRAMHEMREWNAIFRSDTAWQELTRQLEALDKPLYEASDRIRELQGSISEAQQAEHEQAEKALADALRQRRWYELEQYINDRTKRLNDWRTTAKDSNRLQQERDIAESVLAEKLYAQRIAFEQAAQAAGNDLEKGAESVEALGHRFLNRKPPKSKYDTPRQVEPQVKQQLTERAGKPPDYVAELQPAAGNQAKLSTSLLRDFLAEVPEFAVDPHFTVRRTAEGVRLEFQDGGTYRFVPESLGIVLPEDVADGQRIRVDPALIRKAKRGQVLAVTSGTAPKGGAKLRRADENEDRLFPSHKGTVDTSALRDDDDMQRILGNAAVSDAKRGVLRAWHITGNPAQTLNRIRTQDIGTWGYESDDLGQGLYASAVPRFWADRSSKRWAFKDRLSDEQRHRLVDDLIDRIRKEREQHYITENEADHALRALERYRHNGSDDYALTTVAGQPYNIKVTDKTYLRSLGIQPDEAEAQIAIELKGRFARIEASGITPGERQKLLAAGYDGAFIPGGWSGNPQIVVWNKDALVNAYRDESQRFSRTEQKPATGGRRAAVEQAIRPLRREFPSQRIQVVDSVDQLPESVRQDVASRGAEADVEALLAADGSVFLIADNIADPQRAVLAAFHEIVGHAGIDATLKPAYKQRILEYVRRHEPELLEQVKRLYPQSEHTDEVLARLAERYADQPAQRPPWYRRILDILRYAWRRLTGQDFDARDIERVIQRARQYARNLSGGMGRTLASILAWHGGPFDFERFSTEKIGTGEGARAYGWGLYFASIKEVAEYYRNILSGIQFDGQRFDPKNPRHVAAALLNEMTSREEAIKASHDPTLVRYATAELAPGIVPVFGDAVANVLASHGESQITSRGRLYRVELAPNEDELLDWDKPLNQQSEKVQKALRELGFEPNETMTGERAYKRLSQQLDNDRSASLKLRELGVRGIRYLDADSRQQGQGSHNYVIFDDADVTIKAKFSRRPESVKTRIRRITGLERPTGRVISEMTALEMKLRAEAKGSREGWRAAIDQNNALSKEYRRIVTESLPAGEREAALKALVGLNSLARLAGATRRLRKLVIEYELSDAMERLKKLTGKQILTVPRPPTEPKDLSEAEQAERAGRQKVAQIKRMATREIDLTKIDPDWRDRFKPLLEQAKVVALAARNAKTLDEKIAVTEAAGVLFGKLYELNMMHAMEKVEKVGRQKQTIAQLRERFVGLINQAGHLGQPDPQQQQPARDVGFFRRWVGRISATPQTLVQWIERRWDSDGEFAELILHQSREAANAREHQVLDFETRRAQALAEAGYPQWSRKFYDFMAKPQEVQLPDAGTLRLTRSQMVGIYGFINDPDTRDLVVRRGGLMFNFRSDPHAPAFKLTEADMDAVGDMLSEKEKAIIEFFRDYNERYLRDQSAKANYELKGYAPEMHEDYYKRSANMEKVETAGQPPIMRQLMRALENIPEMQERVGGTYYFVPDVIPDTDAVVFDSASLIHLARQVRTVRMLLEHPATSEALRQAFGPSMIREFESFLANLTESPDPQTWDRGTADKLAAMFYRAKLNLNPRTFVNNIVGGTIMLLPMFNMRHLAAGWKHRFDPQVHERMTKASAIAARRWRDPLHRAYGAFGRRHLSEARLSLGEAMAMFKQKLGEKDLRGAWESINQAMDSLSIMHIADSTPFRVAWAAAEAEVQERHPDWSQQQKDQYVLRRFHDAVMRTQNGMTPTETSRLWSAARTSVMLKGLTMLRNQQNKVLNLILQAANADGPTRAKLAMAIGANLLSTGLTRTLFTGTAIGLLIAALRDDDPDEKEAARLLVNGGRRMLTEVFGIVPGGDIAVDGLIGAITRGDTSIFDHPMAQPFEQVARGIGDAASGRLASAVMRMIAATRTLIGDPTQPITTDLYRLWKYGSGVDTRERARRVAGEARRQLVENRNTGGMGEYRKRQLGEIERQGRTISRLEREAREADNPARRQYLQDRADELARQLKARRQEVTAN